MTRLVLRRRCAPLFTVCYFVGVAVFYAATVPFLGVVGSVIGTSTLEEPRLA